MALFQQSDLTFAQAKTKIARSASAEADTDMLTKAGDALEAAFQEWNNSRHWIAMQDTQTITGSAPASIPSCTTTSGSPTVTTADTSNVAVGDVITGAGIPPDSVVTAVVFATSFTINRSTTASGTVTLVRYRRDYALSSNFKYLYSVRNTTTGSILYPVDSRFYDRMIPDQTSPDEPRFYDLFPLGESGYIRLQPMPNAAYHFDVKYHRRITVPSDGGTALDIPVDWEWGLLARAKSIFLTEKGGTEAAATFWAHQAEVALAKAILADSKIPDAEPGFIPGVYVPMVPRDYVWYLDPY